MVELMLVLEEADDLLKSSVPPLLIIDSLFPSGANAAETSTNGVLLLPIENSIASGFKVLWRLEGALLTPLFL